MRHLLSFSVYQDPGALGDDPRSTLASIGADGLELLTSYSEPDPSYRGLAEAVHLPYATDWLAAWQGRPYEMDDDLARFYMYGRSREEVVASVEEAMWHASSLSPAYGVLHAGNADIPELIRRRCTRDSREVLAAFAEMVNEAVSRMPGGEPPFRVLFENLWWPGLRLLDESDFRYLDRRIEFEGWGLCLDTGHMLNCLPIDGESEAIESLMAVFEGYSRDLIDRVVTVHLHWGASHRYRESFEERAMEGSVTDFLASAYSHIGSIDNHLPFSDPRCAELLGILEPSYVTHELPGNERGMREDFRKQRGLLP